MTENCCMYNLSTAHQVEPETAASGGGEQGACEARDDPVLRHRGFLAGQHLGVVETLELRFLRHRDRRTYHPLLYVSNISYTRCTQSLCEDIPHIHGLLHTGRTLFF